MTVGGVPLPLGRGTFPIHVRAGPPSAGTSRLLDGALLSAHAWPVGRRLTVYAQLHDRFGNLCARGGELLSAAGCTEPAAALAVPHRAGGLPRGPGLVVRDRGDGSFEIAVSPRRTGPQALSVTLADGGHVSGSPLALTIAPGTIEPDRCVAVGEGLRHAEATRPA